MSGSRASDDVAMAVREPLLYTKNASVDHPLEHRETPPPPPSQQQQQHQLLEEVKTIVRRGRVASELLSGCKGK